MQTNIEEVTQSKRIECTDYATQTFPIFMKSNVRFMGKSLCAIRYVRGCYVKVETAMGHLMRHSFKFRVDAILGETIEYDLLENILREFLTDPHCSECYLRDKL